MPLEILMSYIYLDSLVRSVNVMDDSWQQMVARLGYSDTLKQYMKYLYKLTDYDPVNFHNYLFYGPVFAGYYKNTDRGGVVNDLLARAGTVISDSGGLLAALTKVDVIVHVYVNDTEQVWYTGGEAIHAHCSIIDPIKGQILPSCNSDFRRASGAKSKGTLAVKGDCFEFEYGRPGESRIQEQGMYTSKRAVPWVTPGNEYVIFASYQSRGGDSTGRYFTCMPILDGSTVLGMYPIRNGLVYDPQDDFHYGTGLTPDAFKAKLRSSIYTILHP
jgi:hypothetical protein